MITELLDGVAAVVEDLAVSLLTGLGGDDDHTVTCLRAVDGGRSGVLENLDALYILRIDSAEAGHLEAVDNVQRIAGATVIGRDTADADRSDGTRVSGGGNDLHTGSLAGECGGDVVDGTVLERFAAHGRDGAGDVALALHTVTDDDGFFNHLGVLIHDDNEAGLIADGNLLLLVSDG